MGKSIPVGYYTIAQVCTLLAFVAPSVNTTDRYGPVITVGGVDGVSGDFSEQ